MTQKRTSKKDKMAIGFAACMLLPAILHFCIFYIYINSQSFVLAVKDDNGWTLEYLSRFFTEITQSGSELSEALGRTLIFFVFSNFVMFPLSLVFSYLLYKKVAGHKYFRIVFFLPSIISATVLVGLFRNIVDGPILEWWKQLTNNSVVGLSFLQSEQYTFSFILVYQCWIGLGGNLIIYSGTMSRIPQEVIESAKIDGVGFWRELFDMVIPLIWPTISTLLLLSFVNIFGASGPLLLFDVENSYKTQTVAHWIFRISHRPANAQYNYAAAAGLVFTVVQLPITFFVRWITKKIDSEVEY